MQLVNIFKNINRKSIYLYILGIPTSFYLLYIYNTFNKLIEDNSEIIDEDELMESESSDANDNESDSSYYFEKIPEEEDDQEEEEYEEKFSWSIFNFFLKDV